MDGMVERLLLFLGRYRRTLAGEKLGGAGSVYTRDTVSLCGSIAVSIAVVAYGLEHRLHRYEPTFAGASSTAAAGRGLAEVYPVTVLAAIWSVIALRRFLETR
jgi:hypothetical protein